MVVPNTVADLHPWQGNPREIDESELSSLHRSMGEMGDLSGIVFNLRTRRLVTGHQRRKKLPDELPVQGYTEVHDDTGTVGTAWVEDPNTGARWAIRYVDWGEQMELLANLTANNPGIQGHFTPAVGPMLETLKTDLPELSDSLRLAAIDIPVDPASFVPQDGSTQPSLDHKNPVKCPECGHEFSPST